MSRFDESLREQVRANLNAFDPARLEPGEGIRRAAVAATIAGDENGEPCFLITRRASTLRSHAGQWALPGGRIDVGETPERAALRELSEEIGVERDESDVLGVLDDYATRSGYLITPVVVWGPDGPTFSIDEAEVASVHLIPLVELDRPDVPRFIEGVDPQRPVIQIPMRGRFVHAPTAAILYQLREVAIHGRPTRVAHFDQPTFAWR